MYFTYFIYHTHYFLTVKHIKSIDGFTGCYRGLMPKLCSYTVSIVACDKTLEYLQKNSPQDNNEDEEDERVRYILKKNNNNNT